MNVRRGGLGRGLGALIPPGGDAVGGAVGGAGGGAGGGGMAGGGVGGEAGPVARFREVPVGSVRPNARQPRSHFDEDAMAELVASIREVGLLQPIVVRETGPQEYELVMGERRWRASRAAGLDRIPAIIRETPDDAMLRDALLENLHRQELNPLEEAAAYGQLLEEFGATHEELASRIGRSRSQVSNTLRLLNLPPAVQRRVAAGVLSAGHARALLGLPTGEEQEELAGRIVAEGLSVRAVEEIVALRAREDDPAGGRAPGRRSGRPAAPGLQHVAEQLSDRFETRVKVEMGRSRGRITLEFASLDDLERILGTMAPGVPVTPDGAPAAVHSPVDSPVDTAVDREGDGGAHPGADAVQGPAGRPGDAGSSGATVTQGGTGWR